MKILKHYCYECESTYKLEYDELICEGTPTYCPWCSSYIEEGALEPDEDY